MSNDFKFVNVHHDTHFYFDIENLPIDILTVRNFSTVCNAILADTTFLIDVLTTVSLQEEMLLEAIAVLHIRWFNQDVYHRGIISKIVGAEKQQKYYSYQFTLSSLLHASVLTQKNRVFIQENLVELVSDLIGYYRQPQLRLQWQLKNKNYPLRDRIQYAESDWDFINRVLRTEGIGFIWQHYAEYSELIFFDDIQLLPNLPGHSNISYTTLSNQVREEESVWNFSAQGEWFRNPLQFILESDCMGFSPGLRFMLEQHPQKNYNRGYRILSVMHFGQQATEIDSSPNSTMGYHNHIICIADDMSYYPDLPAVPKCAQFFTAKINGLQNDLPWLDQQGRYRVTLDFDPEHAKKAPYVMAMLQSYNSLGAGWHFPLRHQTEVLVSYLDSDLAKPIIIGALPNGDSQASVHRFTYYQNNIITKLGNRFSFIDDPQNLQVLLSTPENLNRLHLQAKQNNEDRIELVSEQGDITITAHKKLVRESKGEYNQTIGGQQKITIAKNHQITSKQGSINYQSGKSLQQRSQQDLLIQAKAQSIQVSTRKNLELIAKNNIQITVNQKDAKLASKLGNIHINAAKNLTIQGQQQGPITLQHKQTTIQHTSDNATILTAKNITIKAKNININSKSILHNNTAIPQASGVGRDVDSDKATENSDTDQSSTDSSSNQPTAVEKLFPLINFDLGSIDLIKGSILFDDQLYTYQSKLSGNITLQKIGTYSVGTLSIDSYKLEARNILGNLFADINIYPKNHKQIILGSSLIGELLSSELTISQSGDLHFESSPEPLEKDFHDWHIEGNLAFMIDLKLQHQPPSGIPIEQHSAWYLTEWHNIEQEKLVVATIAIGASLVLIIERLALGALIVALG